MKLIDVEPIIKNLSAMKTQLGYDAIEIDGMIKALREAEEVTAAQQPNDPLTLEELREPANRNVPARFTPGDTVWVVERDKNGNVFEVSGYMFLAAVDYFAVVSAFINDMEDLDETMAFLADDTAENDDTDLCVFPLADVYGTQEAAHAALDAEEDAAGGVSNVSKLDTKEDVP